VEIANRCSTPGCDQTSSAALDLRQMCLEHFIAACYEKLGVLSKNRNLWAVDGTAWESAGDILQECVQRADDLTRQGAELSNLERARLLDIALWASELSRQVRRKHRSTFPTRVRVTSVRPVRHWEEESDTLDMSSYGARLRCKHPVEIADRMKIVRIDTGKQMDARVVWKRRIGLEIQEIGVEFINGGEAGDE